MENMILIDLETLTFDVWSGGIYEVAALAVEDGEIKEKLHLGIVEDESLLSRGYGNGYKDMSRNMEMISRFNGFLSKYNYPLVAHNASFDRKFLVHFDWIDEEYPMYDSIRAIKYKNPKLLSYSMSHIMDYMGIEEPQLHTALGDVDILYRVLKEFNPDVWIPLGQKKKLSSKDGKNLDAFKQDFEVVKNLFAGKSIVFTGKGPYTRNELIELAKKCGANASSNSITKKTNLLVVGEDAGSKLQKAKDAGIEIIDMVDFFEMVGGIELDDKHKNIIESLEYKVEILSEKLKEETISLFPMKRGVAMKAANYVERHSGKAIFSFRQKETTLLVYQPYAEDLATVKKAKDKNIKTMTLGAFNKYIVELEAMGE